MLFHNLNIRPCRSSILVCHICLHLSTQSTNLVDCRYTVGDQIQPLQSLKTQPSTRDHRDVKYHFCNTTAQEILIHICKEKWPKSICEANSQRLLQEPAAKQLPPSLIVREEMKPWEAAGYPFAISSSVLLCPHFSCSCAVLHQMSFCLIFYLGNFQKSEFALIGNSK